MPRRYIPCRFVASDVFLARLWKIYIPILTQISKIMGNQRKILPMNGSLHYQHNNTNWHKPRRVNWSGRWLHQRQRTTCHPLHRTQRLGHNTTLSKPIKGHNPQQHNAPMLMRTPRWRHLPVVSTPTFCNLALSASVTICLLPRSLFVPPSFVPELSLLYVFLSHCWRELFMWPRCEGECLGSELSCDPCFLLLWYIFARVFSLFFCGLNLRSSSYVVLWLVPVLVPFDFPVSSSV